MIRARDAKVRLHRRQADKTRAVQVSRASGGEGEGGLGQVLGQVNTSVMGLARASFKFEWAVPRMSSMVRYILRVVLGSGASEASFDLFSQGASLPTGGFPNPLAYTHSIPSGSTAKIDYRFDHGTEFQFAAEGSWNAKAGDELIALWPR